MSLPKHWDLLLQHMQVPPDPTQTGSFPSQYLDATCKARKSGQRPQWASRWTAHTGVPGEMRRKGREALPCGPSQA